MEAQNTNVVQDTTHENVVQTTNQETIVDLRENIPNDTNLQSNVSKEQIQKAQEVVRGGNINSYDNELVNRVAEKAGGDFEKATKMLNEINNLKKGGLSSEQIKLFLSQEVSGNVDNKVETQEIVNKSNEQQSTQKNEYQEKLLNGIDSFLQELDNVIVDDKTNNVDDVAKDVKEIPEVDNVDSPERVDSSQRLSKLEVAYAEAYNTVEILKQRNKELVEQNAKFSNQPSLEQSEADLIVALRKGLAEGANQYTKDLAIDSLKKSLEKLTGIPLDSYLSMMFQNQGNTASMFTEAGKKKTQLDSAKALLRNKMGVAG